MNKIKFPPIETIIEKAREALNAGQLQCQQPGFTPNSGCLYAGPCVLGAAFSEEDRDRLDTLGGIYNILDDDRDRVEVEHFTREQEKFLIALQVAHDNGDVAKLREMLNANCPGVFQPSCDRGGEAGQEGRFH